MKLEQRNWFSIWAGLLLSTILIPALAQAQQWHTPEAIPVFRGTEAQGRVHDAASSNVKCWNNLRSLSVAVRMYSGDHNDQFPPDWESCQVYIDDPKLLFCPKSPYPAITNWTGFDYSQASYTLLPAKPGDWSNQVIVCKYHGNYALADGSCHSFKDYAIFPVAPKGTLRCPSTALDTAAKFNKVISCINNLKQIGSACVVYSDDNSNFFPTNFQAIESYLALPKLLYCPLAETTNIPVDFAHVDYSNISYTLEPLLRGSDPTNRLATCRYHGNYLQADGAVFRGTNALRAPGILVGQPLSQTVKPGSTATFKLITGYPTEALTFQWRKEQPFDSNGEPFTNSVAIPGATNATLVITNCSAADGGYYDVVATLPSGPHETSIMAYLAVESLDALPADTDAQICCDNLKQIALAARVLSPDDPFIPATADYALGLGWPLTLFCPADSTRRPPENWDSFSIANSSYDIKENVPVGSTNVLAVCKVHHYYVQADGVAVLPDTLRILGITSGGSTRTLNWTGGVGPYQLEMCTNLSSPNWKLVADGITANSADLPNTDGAVFFRVVWRTP